MSNLYCFALTAPALAGAALAPVAPFARPRVLRVEDIGVLVADIAADTLPPKRRFLKAHTALLESLHREHTILPMRFGTIAPGRRALADAVRGNLATIADLLDRLRRSAEFGLTIRAPKERFFEAVLERAPALAARRAALRAGGPLDRHTAMRFGEDMADAVAAERGRVEQALARRLESVAGEVVLRPPEDDCDLLRADLLVPRDRESALTALLEGLTTHDGGNGATAVDGLVAALDPLEIRLIGPAPMFSFAHCHLSFDAPRPAGPSCS